MNNTTENVFHSKFEELIEKQFKLRNNIEVGPSFHFVFDMSKGHYVYLDDQFYNITGYPPSLMIRSKIDFVTDHIHSEDLPQFYAIQKRWKDFLWSMPPREKERFRMSFDFRLVSSEGSIIRLLYQTLHIDFNRAGQMLYIVGKCSDISHWNKSDDMVLSINSSQGFKSYHFSTKQKGSIDLSKFSSLEKRIIKLLAEGFNSKAIAGEMDITFNTANTHRRNMLRKARVRNTSELVSFANNHHLV